jgi:hypothetical protein
LRGEDRSSGFLGVPRGSSGFLGVPRRLRSFTLAERGPLARRSAGGSPAARLTPHRRHPRPILKPRLERVVQHVLRCVDEILLRPYDSIEVLRLPESSRSPEDLVGSFGGKRLPSLDNSRERLAFRNVHHDVHVVRHHAPRQQTMLPFRRGIPDSRRPRTQFANPRAGTGLIRDRERHRARHRTDGRSRDAAGSTVQTLPRSRAGSRAAVRAALRSRSAAESRRDGR